MKKLLLVLAGLIAVLNVCADVGVRQYLVSNRSGRDVEFNVGEKTLYGVTWSVPTLRDGEDLALKEHGANKTFGLYADVPFALTFDKDGYDVVVTFR